MALLLLTLIISGLTLHSWFFIEIQFNRIAFNREFTFVKSDKVVNPRKKHFFNKFKHFILYYILKLNIYEYMI